MSQSKMEEVLHGEIADHDEASPSNSESNPGSFANSRTSSVTENCQSTVSLSPPMTDLVGTAAACPVMLKSSAPVNLKISAVHNIPVSPSTDAVQGYESSTAVSSQTILSNHTPRNTSPVLFSTTSDGKHVPGSSTFSSDDNCSGGTRPDRETTECTGTFDTRQCDGKTDRTGTLDIRPQKVATNDTHIIIKRQHNTSPSNDIEIAPVREPSKSSESISPELMHRVLPINNTITSTEMSPECSVASTNSGAVLDLSSTAPKDLSTKTFPKHSLSRVSNIPLSQLKKVSGKNANSSFLSEDKTLKLMKVQDHLSNLNFPGSNLNQNCNSSLLQSDETINSAVPLDISAGLTTIDTTSLATIDSPHRAPLSLDSNPIPGKPNRVTAHATIIPPLANSVQEILVSVHNDLKSRTPSNSPVHGPIVSPIKCTPALPPNNRSQKNSHAANIPPLTSISDLHSSHFPQPSHQSLIKNPSFNLNNSNCGPQDLKSPSTSPICQPLSAHAASNTPFTNLELKSPFIRNDSKSPCDSSLENRSPLRHCDKSSSAISCVTPARSSCSESPARSPIPPSPCSPNLSSPVVSGAGCEVKGMLANPVSLSTGKEARHCLSASSDASDGGRLTFFKEGKLVLELSHRGNTNNGGGSGSEGENCCWVQVKSKTYWPPPSHSANSGSAHRESHAVDSHTFDCEKSWSRSWRRKRSCPRRVLLSTDITTNDRNTASENARLEEDESNRKPQSDATTNHPSSLEGFGPASAHSSRVTGAGQPSFLLVMPRTARAFRRLHRAACRPVRRDPHYRYHPYASIPALTGHTNKETGHHRRRKYSEKTQKSNSNFELERIHKKHQLEKCTYLLAERLSLRIDHSIGMGQLLDRFLLTSPSPKNFVSPRKRILKQHEADHDSQLKKRNLLSSTCGNRSCNGTEGGTKSGRHGGAGSGTGSSGASPHSIDSILSSEKQNESYLKSLLRPASTSKQRSHYGGSGGGGGGGGGGSHHPPCEPKTENIKQENLPAASPPSYKRDLGQHSRGWNFQHDRRESSGQRREVDERRNGDDRRADSRRETDERRERDERRESNQRWEADYGGYRARSPCDGGHLQNNASLPTTTSTHTPKNVHGDTPTYPPGYNALPPHNLPNIYPQLFDPNYLFLNGLNPLTAGGIMSNPHNQMALAAAAAAAAAASISSISSYGLGSFPFNALAATQYSNLLNSALNPVAFGPGLPPNLPAALTPALTPGSALPSALPLSTLNPATLPPTLTPGASPAQLPHHPYTPIVTSTNSSSVCNNNSSPLLYSNSSTASNPPYSSSRTSPYPNHNTRSPCPPQSNSPYPHSRSPYSPHARSTYSPHAKTHNYRSKSPFRGPASTSSYPSSYQPKVHSQQQYHHPTQQPPSRHASPWKSSVVRPPHPRKPSQDQESTQDLPLNLSKPRPN